MKILELFGGIGACTKSLKNLGVEVEIVDYVEVDKFAVKSYNAINGTDFEPQDIREWDKDIKVDLIMHGSPCQDFSLAGKQAGGDIGSGTRSSLMYETLRIVSKLRPKYVLWENVKNLLSTKHKHNFDKYLEEMERLGYKNYYQVLNSKHYGIPQSRERIFTVSVLDSNDEFVFPKGEMLKGTLQDFLEDKVDDKYYLSEKMIKYISSNNEKWTGNNKKSLVNKIIASAINTGEGQRRCDASNYISDDLDINCDLKCIRLGGLFDTDTSKHQAGSIYDTNGLSPTLDTMQGGYRQPCIIDKDIKIRKLTPKECWRLMGFDDEDFDKAQKAGVSDTQLYKQAGNSIVVNVLEKILDNLIAR